MLRAMDAALIGLTVCVLGLAAGAVLAEGAVLVPYWRSLPAAEFLRWYREHGALLLRFFGPLEGAAALLACLAAAVSARTDVADARALGVAAALTVSVLAAFPLYFRRVNASFAEGSIPADRVAAELRRWARWHWLRVALASGGFAAAVLATMADAR